MTNIGYQYDENRLGLCFYFLLTRHSNVVHDLLATVAGRAFPLAAFACRRQQRVPGDERFKWFAEAKPRPSHPHVLDQPQVPVITMSHYDESLG